MCPVSGGQFNSPAGLGRVAWHGVRYADVHTQSLLNLTARRAEGSRAPACGRGSDIASCARAPSLWSPTRVRDWVLSLLSAVAVVIKGTASVWVREPSTCSRMACVGCIATIPARGDVEGTARMAEARNLGCTVTVSIGVLVVVVATVSALFVGRAVTVVVHPVAGLNSWITVLSTYEIASRACHVSRTTFTRFSRTACSSAAGIPFVSTSHAIIVFPITYFARSRVNRSIGLIAVHLPGTVAVSVPIDVVSIEDISIAIMVKTVALLRLRKRSTYIPKTCSPRSRRIQRARTSTKILDKYSFDGEPVDVMSDGWGEDTTIASNLDRQLTLISRKSLNSKSKSAEAAKSTELIQLAAKRTFFKRRRALCSRDFCLSQISPDLPRVSTSRGTASIESLIEGISSDGSVNQH